MRFIIEYDFTEEEENALKAIAEETETPIDEVIDAEYHDYFLSALEEVCEDLINRSEK